jgi:hypothetical protein
MVRLVCAQELKPWKNNGLKQNDDETEFIIFCPKSVNAVSDTLSLEVGNCVIHPSHAVRNLCVMLDRNIDMEKHVNYYFQDMLLPFA